MRSFLYVLTALVVMGLAFWAYRENYATQSKISEIDGLRSEIAHLTESLGVLKAEWAYLNRPDRLRELVAINFARLPLLPMQADQFAAVAQVAYPPEAVAPEDLPPELLAPQAPATPGAPVASADATVAYAVPVNQGSPRVTPRAKPATRPIVAQAAAKPAAAPAAAAKPAPEKVAEVSATKPASPAAAKPAATAAKPVAAKPAAAPPAKRPQTRPIETSAAVAAAMADQE